MSFTLVAFTFAALAAQDVPTSSVGGGGDLGASAPAASAPAPQSGRAESSSEARPSDGAAEQRRRSGSHSDRIDPRRNDQRKATSRICRRIVTSRSHRYQRVCLTAEEWRRHGQLRAPEQEDRLAAI